MIKQIFLLKKGRKNFFSLENDLLMYLLQVNSNVKSNFKKVLLSSSTYSKHH